MYHFQQHDVYTPYPYQQQCQIFSEQPKNTILHAGAHLDIQKNVEAPPQLQTLKPVADKKTKVVTNKNRVDTSHFSIEERLIAAVWVHERKHTKISMSQIKQDFRQRFGRDPPAKNTLLVWERKLFSTGSVHDAPRPGRPVNRRCHTEQVAASLAAAPALSLRARARALRLPRTTLRTILQRDLAQPRSYRRKAASKTKSKESTEEMQAELGAGACAETRNAYK